MISPFEKSFSKRMVATVDLNQMFFPGAKHWTHLNTCSLLNLSSEQGKVKGCGKAETDNHDVLLDVNKEKINGAIKLNLPFISETLYNIESMWQYWFEYKE